MARKSKVKSAPSEAVSEPRRLDIEYRELALAEVIDSDTNPRGEIDESDPDFLELVESVRAQGVLQPPLARPYHGPKKGITHELVFGCRRRRAAAKVGLARIVFGVARLADHEVLEMQIHENHQRKDVDPIREAESLKRLRDEFHVPFEEISARTGLTRSFVYQRLRLAESGPAALAALRKGDLTHGVVMQIARIRDAKRRAEATKQLLRYEGCSVFEARNLIERDFLLDLKTAGWSLDDATLVPDAGACKSCPNRANNQQELFGEATRGADLCTDSACFAKKVAAHRERSIEQAREKGHNVVDGKSAEKFFKWGRVDGATWIDLGDAAHEIGDRRKWRVVLAPILEQVKVTVVPDEHGTLHHLVARKATLELARVEKILKPAADAVTAGRDQASQAQARERKRAKAARDRDAELLAGVIQKLEPVGGVVSNELVAWYAVGVQLCERAEHEDLKAMARRHELDMERVEGPKPAIALLMRAEFEAKALESLARLVIELACSGLPHNYNGYKTAEPLLLMSQALGVEPKVNVQKRERRKAAKAASAGEEETDEQEE